ncbi:MAG: M23 family metallopeptidase [Desulfobacterales bacterium]
MRKKISLVILSNSGGSARQVTISAAFLKMMVFGCLVAATVLVYDYYRLKLSAATGIDDTLRLTSQSEEIIRQREQIQEFAGEISTLKAKLVTLNDFEKKIRIIANIDSADEENNLFGIGGSIPEDLDTQIPLTCKHNSLIREMHEQVGQLQLASHHQDQSFDKLLKRLQAQQSLLASTPAVRPCPGWTTSSFGYRISPFTGRREFHKGFDIANRKGTPVVSTADGMIAFAGPKGLLGNSVFIDHGHGMVTRYGHLEKVMVARGKPVKRGDTIGLMGSTGRSTGPHVHYEVHLNGIPVNPDKYILN